MLMSSLMLCVRESVLTMVGNDVDSAVVLLLLLLCATTQPQQRTTKHASKMLRLMVETDTLTYRNTHTHTHHNSHTCRRHRPCRHGWDSRQVSGNNSMLCGL